MSPVLQFKIRVMLSNAKFRLKELPKAFKKRLERILNLKNKNRFGIPTLTKPREKTVEKINVVFDDKGRWKWDIENAEPTRFASLMEVGYYARGYEPWPEPIQEESLGQAWEDDHNEWGDPDWE